jgi:UDP-2,3-diacylglucosamine hydrolase
MLPSCLTIPFAHNWSSHSRKAENNDCINAALHNITNFAKEHAQSNPDIDFYVFGHLHTIANEPINDTTRCIVLGDWIDKFSYAVFDGENITIENFNN